MIRTTCLQLIRLYQKTLSPDSGWFRVYFPYGCCRYTPTCSQYMHDAITRLGVFRGTLLGAQRVLRCHPWSKGGIDRVTQHS